MASAEQIGLPPQVGMLATVRNRRGIITAVEPYAGQDGVVCNLVTVEYLDADGGVEDALVWEREVNAHVIPPSALPEPDRLPHMAHDEFDALVRATRWSALTPFVDPDGSEGPMTRLPIISPVHGALQVEDFQLVPLLQALRMPRVSLMLADDVGLGKTIEAGLVLSELLNRRRIRRVLIIGPASLCLQWQQEMTDKFSLTFDIVNRDETHALRKRMGLDANPWRTYSRIITSYYYLKQPDVLEEFLSASRPREGSPHLPWDLLIVDEAHNLTPSPFGEDSDLAKMLGRIAHLFEHRIFLTATPHNGHTRCFTGLLERLDPVRFSQTSELPPAERARMSEVVIRRLKSDINARTNPHRFCERHPHALMLQLGTEERALSRAFGEFRAELRKQIASMRRREQVAGSFAIEVLGKRLLSCPVAFADSWWRCRDGMRQDEQAQADEVQAAERAANEDVGDDRETESRTAHAARVVGAWLKPFVATLRPHMERIDAALTPLGLMQGALSAWETDPTADARFDALCTWIDEHLRSGATWRDDERLVIFTEYKTTLDYLERRLKARYRDAGQVIRLLFGGMDLREREEIKYAFNNPHDPVRILLATDTGSEGLNLQETARYLLHFDVPWNPARLEQRNGRLDRHGQARDVSIFHFGTDDDADLAFLAHVVRKVNAIREDLGSIGEIFDEAFESQFIRGEDARAVLGNLELRAEKARGKADIPRTSETETGEEEVARLEALKGELDLSPDALQETLDVAMGIGSGRPRLVPDNQGRLRFAEPIPERWKDLVDDSVRRGGAQGAMQAMVFNPAHFIINAGGRPVFRPLRDTILLHLAHPLFRRVLTEFAHARFPGNIDERLASRWTVRRGDVPAGADAVLLLTVEELAVNDLRETFHHWVRTWRIPINAGSLLPSLPHEPACRYRLPKTDVSSDEVARARDIWADVYSEVRALVAREGEELTSRLRAVLDGEKEQALKDEQARFQSRQGELSALIQKQTIESLERELTQLRAEREQMELPGMPSNRDDRETRIRLLEEEIQRRQGHYAELLEQLARERKRVMDFLIPNRYQMRGKAQVFPVAVEIRLP